MHYLFSFRAPIIMCLFFYMRSIDGICQPEIGVKNPCVALCLEQDCNAGWSCKSNSSFLKNCKQECYGNSCSKLSCNALIEKCTQNCDGCDLMMCNSSQQCQQHCSGQCNGLSCSSAEDCFQICQRCGFMRCCGNKQCRQTCIRSNCSLVCSQSGGCLQNCYGQGCSSKCYKNTYCSQKCHTNSLCPELVCDSETCQQTCYNMSKCNQVRCSGQQCKQENHSDQGSTMECFSSSCDQKSFFHNTTLSCKNMNGICKQTCFGHGCSMHCGKNVKTCVQRCDGGYCNMTCPLGVDTCNMDCQGGRCFFSCEAKHCLLSCKDGLGNCYELNRKRGKCNSGGQHLINFIALLLFICASLRLDISIL